MPDSLTGETETKEPSTQVSEGSVVSEGKTAESPTAAGEARGSMVDAVKAALEGKPEGGESPAPQEAATQEAKTEQEEELGEVTDEELRSYHSKTRRRIKGLIEQVNTARAEADGLKDRAGRFDGLMTYISNAGLSRDEINQGFDIMSTMVRARTDPAAAQRALEMLTPLVVQLQQAVGHELPEDLRNEVRQGFISEARARELAQLRGTSQMHALGAREREQQLQQEREANAHQTRLQSVTTAATEWERAWQRSDPDYAVKQPMVLEAIQLAALQAEREGKPIQTAQEFVALANKAKAGVEARIKHFRPRQQQQRDPLSADSGGSSGTTAAEPKSMLEAVSLAARSAA